MAAFYIFLAMLGLTLTGGSEGAGDQETDEPVTGSEDDEQIETDLSLLDATAESVGGDGDDLLVGNDDRDSLSGGEGDDTLVGNGDDDLISDLSGENLLFGGNGDDRIIASAGSTVDGGDGIDRIQLYLDSEVSVASQLVDFDPDEDVLQSITLLTSDEDAADLTYIETQTGTDVFWGDVLALQIDGATPDEFEAPTPKTIVEGASFTDDDQGNEIRVGRQSAEVYGAGGDDYIQGALNAVPDGDTLFGGDGDDTLTVAEGTSSFGPTAASEAFGGDGDDIIISSNANILTGGAGADSFGLRAANYPQPIQTVDPHVITDFEETEDKIYLDAGYVQAGSVVSVAPWSDGTGADILVDTVVVAKVAGGQDLTPSDIIVAPNGVLTELLGFH